MLTISDLVQICRNDPTYRKFGENEKTLEQLALIRPGADVHDSVRNIVLSSFVGEGLELEMVSPIAQ
jgi:hypothetical protein